MSTSQFKSGLKQTQHLKKYLDKPSKTKPPTDRNYSSIPLDYVLSILKVIHISTDPGQNINTNTAKE